MVVRSTAWRRAFGRIEPDGHQIDGMAAGAVTILVVAARGFGGCLNLRKPSFISFQAALMEYRTSPEFLLLDHGHTRLIKYLKCRDCFTCKAMENMIAI